MLVKTIAHGDIYVQSAKIASGLHSLKNDPNLVWFFFSPSHLPPPSRMHLASKKKANSVKTNVILLLSIFYESTNCYQ